MTHLYTLSRTLLALMSASLLLMIGALSLASAEPQVTQETECADGIDNDQDSVIDCADADCSKTPDCKPDGGPENTNSRCRDWIDNDEDGATDCEDQECQMSSITACQGSWDKNIIPVKASKTSASHASKSNSMTLIGSEGDKDGERNDQLCSDGIDNDNDGKIDCQDPGCLFDASVRVCRGSPNMRFSVVGQIAHTMDLTPEDDDSSPYDTRISRLQLRSFGPITQIERSFYLISILTEKTPRFTFAMFNFPIGDTGHTLTINSGAAGLSQAQALSVHKQLLVSRTNVFRAFEQFNSAALEVSGPLDDKNKLRYRVFGAGGNGRFDGNIGGRSLGNSGLNYPWSVGGQLGWNIVGYYSRFDTPFLYTPVPLTIGLLAGAKYDRREAENFYSTNFQLAIRWKRLVLIGEHYWKDELEFEARQAAWHAQLGFLLIPQHLMLAGDFGQFQAEPFGNPPEGISTTVVREPKDETQYRVALHWYFYRQIGVFSAVYSHRFVEEGLFDRREEDNQRDLITNELSFIAQFRF